MRCTADTGRAQDFNLHVIPDVATFLMVGQIRQCKRSLRNGRHLARNPEHPQAIRPVRRHFEIENSVPQHRTERRSDLDLVGKDQHPFMSLRQAQFLLGAEYPSRDNPLNMGDLHHSGPTCLSIYQASPNRRKRHLIIYLKIRGAAHDCDPLARQL